ncbi:hypothetical protein BDV37DRAFT_270395 [Aspergillus pseudonomiae]|uniref:Uncharacterized protein n=1 Tax=Aspergillus pseudonomiae TaxID=1506151 RepID=A0A5N7DI62_9EURO|nr:uncharacterized protein BDV37DRAFT_270395 [Aspergillus pseudonomiae]KAE8405935.1 hypothetical protein BDV37DRAFT_270395 [Aspergillus pseudonomiae]
MECRIDIYYYYVPVSYRQALEKMGRDLSGWPTPDWTVKDDEKICQDYSVETAILSITAPGTSILKGAKAAKLARDCNIYIKGLKDKYTKNYSFFAIFLDLLDTKVVLEKIRFSLDYLDTNSIIVYTRYSNSNYYLGYPKLTPIWEELNHRLAVVFVYPTHGPMIDYPHETTRAMCDLITTDTIRKFPNCKLLLLRDFTKPGYILFRSDFPYAPEVTVKTFSYGLSKVKVLDKDRDDINR